MRILHVIDSGGMYGAEVMLLNLMSEQVALGLQPTLANIGDLHVADKPIEAEARRRGLRVKSFRMRPGPNLRGAFEVLRFAWQECVEVLHSHGYKGNILFGFIPRELRRMPMVATVHGWTWTGGITRMMIYEWLDGLSLGHLDRVILVNEAMKDHPRLRNRPKLAIDVVANGIPVDSLPGSQGDETILNRDIVSFCRKGFTIGAIGRLSGEKGFDLLLEAIADLIAEGKDVRLVLLGEGGLRNHLEKKIRDLELQGRVLMPGYVTNARNYLPLFHIFVMPSLTEGLPIVLLEAMQTGVPIVASEVCGIPDVLAGGKAGVLTKPGSKEAIKKGIKEVMSNPATAVRRVQFAKKRIYEEYSSQKMAEKYLEIYIKVGGKKCAVENICSRKGKKDDG